MSKRAWVGISAAVLLLVVAGVGYALLLRSANEAVEGALARFEAQLPPGGSLTYAGYEVDLLERSVVLDSPVLNLAGQGGFAEASAARAVVMGLEPDPTETRARLATLTDVRLVDAADPDRVLTAARIEVQDLRMPGGVRTAAEALAAAEIGDVRLTGIGFVLPEVEMALESLNLSGLKGGRLERIGLNGLSVEVLDPAGAGGLQLDRFALEGLDLGPVLRDLDAHGRVALAPNLPGRMLVGLRGLSLEGLRLETRDLPGPLELARAAFTEPQVVDGRLVGGRGEMRDLVVPLGGELTRPLRFFLPGLPLGERVTVSMTASQRYDSRGAKLTLDQNLEVRDLVDIGYAVALGNVATPPHPGMSEIELQAAMLGAALAEGEVVVRDRGLVRPLLESLAARAGQPVEAYVAGLVDQLRRNLALLEVGAAADEAVGAVQAFLSDPQALRVAVDPDESVPLLLLAAAGTPRDAIALLQPKITAAAD
jgi:hypothetical protein